MDPAIATASTPAVVTFEDGFGERHQVLERGRNELVEILCLRAALTAVPSFEFALRERVSHLAPFRHGCYARVRSVERLSTTASTLALVSDATPGVRLSDLLAFAGRQDMTLDIDAALCLLRQLVPTVAMLHEDAPDSAHGAIAAERIVVTPAARIVVVEHVMGAAVGELRFSAERYWKELRVALPRMPGPAKFDHRSDVTQIAVVAVALILGRPLLDDEVPSSLGDVVASSWANSARGGLEPLPAGLRAWLTRALQLDPRNRFDSAIDAQEELERVLGESDYLAAPATLETLLAQYRATLDEAAAAILPQPPPIPEPAPISLTSPAASVAAPTPAVAPAPVVRPVAIVTPAPIVAPTPVTVPTPVAQSAVRHIDTPAVVPHVFPAPLASESGELWRGSPKRDEREGSKPAEPVRFMDEPLPPARKEPFVSHVETAQPRKRWPIAAAAMVLIAVAGAGVPAARRYVMPSAAVAEGTLSVTTNPAGARLFVDGVERGATPLIVTLKPGAHALELRGDGAPRLMTVTVTAGAQASQYIELPQTPTTFGQLQVRTVPPGARVSVDGLPRGTSPITVQELTPGEHAVLLESTLGSVKQTVTIEAAITASLTVPLGAAAAEGVAVSGWIALSAPADVQVFENSRLLGSSQSDRLMVSAGRHEIEIVNETLGFRATRSVQVSSGKVTPVKIEFPKGIIALNAIPWAEVWADGEKVGDTPIGNLQLTIGSHDFVFRHPELGEQRQTATVTLKTPARLSVDLRKK
jgi:hypothetical protein